ncbi:MAG: thiol:disulfide interchange protein DsbA/DsbL [bacterium]|jgi:thiol:disulfide interchange protein DsbA
MRLIKQLSHWLVAASFGLMAFSVVATPTDPAEGVEYQRLQTPQPTDTGKKIEVLEFFWYNCPHCFAFEPSLSEWAKKRGDSIVLRRVPVGFRESFIPQQKLYFTLEIMNRFDVHRAVFDAVHVAKQKLDKEEQIVEFIEKQGVDKKKFLETFNSFTVQSKVNRVRQLMEAYRIDGVPTVVIDGQYITSPSIVGTALRGQSEQALNAATLQVMDALLAKKK